MKKRKLTLLVLLIFLTSIKISYAFIAPSSITLVVLALKGIIPQLILITTGLIFSIKKHLVRKRKVSLLLLCVISIILGSRSFANHYQEYREINPANLEEFLTSIDDYELYEYIEENYVDLNNVDYSSYMDYKIVSSNPNPPIGLINTTYFLRGCFFDINCTINNLERANISKTDKILLYCYNTMTSAVYGKKLSDRGYKNIKVTGLASLENDRFLHSPLNISQQNIIIIEKLKKDQINNYNWVTVYFGIDAIDIFFFDISANRFRDKLVIVTTQELAEGYDNLGDVGKNSEEIYSFTNASNIQQIHDLPENFRFVCTHNLHCLLTKEFIYNRRLNIDKIYFYSV